MKHHGADVEKFFRRVFLGDHPYLHQTPKGRSADHSIVLICRDFIARFAGTIPNTVSG